MYPPSFPSELVRKSQCSVNPVILFVVVVICLFLHLDFCCQKRKEKKIPVFWMLLPLNIRVLQLYLDPSTDQSVIFTGLARLFAYFLSNDTNLQSWLPQSLLPHDTTIFSHALQDNPFLKRFQTQDITLTESPFCTTIIFVCCAKKRSRKEGESIEKESNVTVNWGTNDRHTWL